MLVVCTVRTAEGVVVARKSAAVRTDVTLPRPQSAVETRRLAAQLLSQIDLSTMLPMLAEWCQQVRDVHEGSIQRRLNRVHALSRTLTATTQGPVQPGLFDRRTQSAEASVQRAYDRLASEHAQAIHALERSTALEVKCEPSALLLLWP